MQARATQFLNEIISLIIMALMIVALVAGQAAATPRATAIDDVQSNPAGQVVNADFSFRHKGE